MSFESEATPRYQRPAAVFTLLTEEVRNGLRPGGTSDAAQGQDPPDRRVHAGPDRPRSTAERLELVGEDRRRLAERVQREDSQLEIGRGRIRLAREVVGRRRAPDGQAGRVAACRSQTEDNPRRQSRIGSPPRLGEAAAVDLRAVSGSRLRRFARPSVHRRPRLVRALPRPDRQGRQREHHPPRSGTLARLSRHDPFHTRAPLGDTLIAGGGTGWPRSVPSAARLGVEAGAISMPMDRLSSTPPRFADVRRSGRAPGGAPSP